jgi:LAGLIDADG DNA endonuclease family protein
LFFGKPRPLSEGVVEPPTVALRRLPPDCVQLQIILGSLLGDGRLVGAPRDRRLCIAHRADRSDYVRWKYERLASLAATAPRERHGVVSFETITHPLFDDLALILRPRPGRTRAEVIARLLRPLGLAVWLADVGRLELRADAFLPQQELALAS